MSTSSDKQKPEAEREPADQAVIASWDGFSSLVNAKSRIEFTEWLDEELGKMENDLKAFASTRERLGRR